MLGGTVAGCVSAEPMIEAPLSLDAIAPVASAAPETGADQPRPDRAWRLRLTRL